MADTRRKLLAKLLKAQGIELPPSGAVTSRAAGAAAPLSISQERLWFLQQLECQSSVYQISRALRVKGGLNRQALTQAFKQVIRRHEILRTTFPYVDDRPIQRVTAAVGLSLNIVKLTTLSPAKRRVELPQLLRDKIAVPFEIERGPLVRAELFNLGEQENVLLLVLHQLVCDGWSINLLLRELACSYRGIVKGEAPALPPIKYQYGEFAAQQRAQLENSTLRKDLVYWKQRLENNLSGVALVTDRPRPAQQSFRGSRFPLTVPASMAGKLRRFGVGERASMFMVLMAAFNLLLWRYSGQNDISVGFPVANRDTPDSQNLIGFFVNTLVLRTDLSGQPTFRRLLQRVRRHCRDALVHQELSFDRLVEELQRERDLSRNPLFQVMFAYQNYPAAQLDLLGLRVKAMDLQSTTAKFDLTLSLTEEAEGLTGFIEYSSDLFDRSTIARMARHWEILLRGIVADPDRSIADLPLLDKAERRRILIEWNRTDRPLSRELCIHELFETQTRRTPDAVALQCAGRQILYRELNDRANRLAGYLQKRGIGPEKLVGVCMERSVEMVVGLLAILKAGAAYLPLDPEYPRERIAFMLDDARSCLLLTQEKFAADERSRAITSLTAKLDMQVVCVDREWPVIERESAKNRGKTAAPRNLAYVIYTSGSTGRPKGVAIEHRNAAAFLQWAGEVFSPAELAGVLASTSICFDLSIFELFTPLSQGGKVILVEDALATAEIIERKDLTLINTVPSVVTELLDAHALLRSVRTVNLAGEALKPELVRRLYESGTVRKVYDLYGPSETTTYSTFTLRRADARATIGRPIANTKIYLLDAALQPVPVGVPGELYIGGAGVARGYLRRTKLTSERFLRDPFAKRRGARMYRTGDLARYYADGAIEYLGRVDNQVKIRGFRIELGEVEAALAAHPAVRQCVVVAHESNTVSELSSNPKSGKQLVGYIIANSQQIPTVAELRAWLGRKLPEFMLPSIFVPLDALPLLPNGKADRLALPPPDFRGPRSAKEFIAPRTAVEELVAEVWREVLNVERIGVFDNFFDLGGHSLLATRVVARLRAQVNVDLALRKVFELPIVAGLAAHIESLRRERSGVALAQISAAPDRRWAPLSSAQRRLWFLHKRDGGLTAYNMPAAYRVKGRFHLAAFEGALNGIIQRHGALRSAIVQTGAGPAQEILPEAKLAVRVVDLSRLPRVQREREIDRYAAEDAEHPFDLQRVPLLRVEVLRVSKDDHVLLVNFHHIICDGSSLAVFFQELARRYEALLKKREFALAPPALQYSDFAWWQDRALRDGALATEIAYWKRQLFGLRSVDLPADYARKEEPTYRGGKLSQRLPAELTRGVKKLSRAESVTLFMTLLAALKIMLARLSGQDDVVVGSTIAGRSRPEVDGLIGFFINALALRSDLSGNPTFVELLGRVRAVCLDAYTHQDLPFERLVEELNPKRDPGRNPLFQVLFNMADIAERELTLQGCRIVKLRRAAAGAKFDLVFQAPEVGGCIELALIYNADLFSERRAQSMLDQWASLLAQIAGDPERRLQEFSLLTPEAAALLPNPRASLDETWFGAIHELIERQALLRPEKVAITDDQESWNYRELDRQSNRLAYRLRRVGVRPKDAVALYAHRDVTITLAILAVLKAGAIFAILDPAYPAARLVDYLRITRPKALLQMAGAGNLPAAVEAHLHSAKPFLRVFLPRGKKLIAKQLEKYSDQGLAIELGLDDPAYIAFTSGSTGEPKGVFGRHGPISHFLPWQNKTFELKASDRYALLSGLGYNHLHRDLFTALATGATLHIPRAEQLQDPEQLLSWLQLREISILHLTPAFGRLLEAVNKRQTLPALRRIFFGGDSLARRDAAAMRELAPHATIVTFYGATETQRAVGYAVVAQPATEKNPASPFVPTGRGAQDVQLLLLTANRQLAGIGEIGELYVRSPHLAAGYLNDRALSEVNFIVNPFTEQSRDRLYRTGELGRYLPDGAVEWVGRKERSASIRGFRVELAEVEAALLRFPGLRAGAAIAVAGSALEEAHLIAYAALDPSIDADTEELLCFLRAQLPHYMVPSQIYFLERLPLNPSGKIDYAGLTQLQSIMQSVDRPYEGPRGDLEAAVEKILAQLLRLERIGRHDHFFALGGHSLLAAQAAARIRETLGVKLDLRAFLEQPTLAALCQRIEKANTQEREEIEL
jgi:amino acid adenylation domain-containing protein